MNPVLGGSFTFVGGQARARIARLNSDGVVDGTFNPGTGANNTVNSIAVQAGGKILLGGDFTSVNGTVFNRIARLNADGSVDATFNLGTGADNTVECVALEADGGVLLGGTFLNVNGVPRNYLARILNDPASQILGILSSAQVRWTRDGSAPEIGQVTFELSLDGGLSWSPLGAGTRTVASWEKTGLSLPVNGTVRARGRTAGGLQNSSSGLVESLVRFGPDSDNDGLLDSWELTYFFTLIGQNALDDSDHDGLNNLEELAFGLNPTFPDSAAQPQVVNEGGYLTITLAKHPGATYLGESGSTPSALSAATTTVLTDNATTLKVRDNILIGTAPARFLHVKITAAP